MGEARPLVLDLGGPIAWTAPPARGCAGAVVMLHAIGENRTGNNYLFRMLADAFRAAGLAPVRFDLPGCGEAGGALDIAEMDRAVDAVAQATGGRWPGVPTHYVARRLSAALLPATGSRGLRVALYPPNRSELDRLGALIADHNRASAVPTGPRTADLDDAWVTIGAEPALVGGLNVPQPLVHALAARIDPPRWDLAVDTPADQRPEGGQVLVATADKLTRGAADRAALAALLPSILVEADRWRPACS